jgi:hypothetical protein
MAFQLTWPTEFVLNARDKNGIHFGDKSTTLEALGLLFAIVQFPEFFKNQNVVVKIDNLGVVWGMLNQKAKEDKVASVIIRTILLLCAYLECILHVEHRPRVSDWGSKLDNRLSRRCTTSPQDQRLLQNWSRLKKIPPCLVEWLSQPRWDWGLANRVLSYVVNS